MTCSAARMSKHFPDPQYNIGIGKLEIRFIDNKNQLPELR